MERMRGMVTTNPLRAMMPKKPAYSQTKPAANDELNLNRPMGPITPELHVASAKLAERSQQIDSAREHYQKAVTTAPNNLSALRAAAHFEDRQGQFGAAEHLYRRAMAASGGDAGTLNDLALCTARQGRLDESRALLKQAVAKVPDKALYRNNLATVLVESNDIEGAIAELAAVHPPGVAEFNVARLLEKRGRTDEAAVYFAQAAAIDPALANPSVAQAAPSTPLADPRLARSALVSQPASENWSAPAVQSPSTSLATPAWSPAVSPRDITPMERTPADSTQWSATPPTVDNAGPKLLPPVR